MTTPTIESQAQELVSRLEKGQPIQEPLNADVERAASEIIDKMEKEKRKKIRQELENLKKVAGKNPEQIKSELDASLSEITSQDFDKIKGGIEKAKVLLEGFEKVSPQYKEGMHGIFGSLLMDRLVRAGYSISLLGGNKINIVSENGANNSRATQIETYLRSVPGISEILALGMIYRSSEIRNYSDTYLQPDKKTIKPDTPRNYLEYLRDVGKSNNPNDLALLNSRTVVESILSDPIKVKGIIVGTPFFDATIRDVRDNGAIQAAIDASSNGRRSSHHNHKTTTPSSNQPNESKNSAPSTSSSTPPNNLVAKYLGKAGLAIEGGASDIFNTPGAFPALIVAFIATWIFGDLKKALIVLAGGFGISSVANGYASLANGYANKENSSEKENPPPPQQQNPVNIPSPKPIDKTGINGKRLEATERVEKNQELSRMVESVRKSQLKKKVADISDYVAFINTELQTRKSSELINPSDEKFSIFSDDAMFNKSGKDNLDELILKRILRVYLGTNARTSDPQNGQKKGTKERVEFTQKYKTVLSAQNSTLKDLVEAIK